MDSNYDIGPELPKLVDGVLASYRAHDTTQHIGRVHFASRKQITELLERMLELLYPGYLGRKDLTDHNISYHIGELLPRIAQLAYDQIDKCLRHEQQRTEHRSPDEKKCDRDAREITHAMIERIPHMREVLADDVHAALDGDPAATGTDEIIIAYPGILAVSVYRIAHELHNLGVPLMPRIMSEWVHRETGVDIHPGARIGRRFFIDHATGVVIGETTDIGDDVKIYQGVTLGALSFPKDDRGRIIREAKRHPTVEDNVTIYANAIVLGGKTVIGAHSQIGGSVFLTTSVPPHSTVTIPTPDLRVKGRDGVSRIHDGKQNQILPDYQI